VDSRTARGKAVSHVDLEHGSRTIYPRFLSFVDLLGTTYTASTLATGYGAYIAQPLLRKAVEGREDLITEEEARKILEDSMRVLFYRDARSLNKVQQSLSLDSVS
jgi:20S proteasome alpha/beta subunit